MIGRGGMKKYEAGLKRLIAQNEKVSVANLCAAAGRKRGDFKYRFRTMANFISSLLEYKLEVLFRKTSSLSKIISKLLHALSDEAEYYHVVFDLLNTGKVSKRVKNNISAYRKLERIFLREIEKYVKQSGILRMSEVEGCASHICSRIQVWILHDFHDTPQTIYHELRASINIIEVARSERA